MKILLCCTSIEDGHRSEDVHDTHYPLGLAYLQSYLEKHRPEKDEFVNLYLNNIPYDESFKTLKRELKNLKPDVFGVSMMTHSRVSAFRAIEYAHQRYPKMKIVVGGMHPTVMWEQIARKFPYIVVCRGEGEVTFKNIIDLYEKDGDIREVEGIAVYDQDTDEVFTTGNAPLIEDLDTLPFPKHELFVTQGKTMANLLTSRGCPYRCNFCVLDWMSKRQVRFRSGGNIADEIEMLLDKYPSIRTIWIHDDAFMINNDRTIEFCDAIIERGIKTQFVASARFRPISHEVVFKMKQAGFVQVLFGLESGAAEVIKGMRKGISKEHARYGLELFSKTGMKATAFIIVGLPGETEDTIEETIDFVQQLQDIDYLYYEDIGTAMLYPGTEMYTQCRETGLIDDDYWLSDGDIPYYTKEFGGVHSMETLNKFKKTIQEGISLKYLFTREHFLKQRKLIPKILQYSQRFPLGNLNQLLPEIIAHNNLTPALLQSLFLRSNDDLIKHISSLWEQTIVNQIINSDEPMTKEDREKFIQDWISQVAKDEEWLLKCEEQMKEVRAKLENVKDVGDVEYKKKAEKSGLEVKQLDFKISTMGGV